LRTESDSRELPPRQAQTRSVRQEHPLVTFSSAPAERGTSARRTESVRLGGPVRDPSPSAVAPPRAGPPPSAHHRFRAKSFAPKPRAMPPRLFIGIRPPEPVREALLDTMEALEGARWVDADNLHLTLRFIRAVERPAANALTEPLEGIDWPRFDLRIPGVGAFDRTRRHHS